MLQFVSQRALAVTHVTTPVLPVHVTHATRGATAFATRNAGPLVAPAAIHATVQLVLVT